MREGWVEVKGSSKVRASSNYLGVRPYPLGEERGARGDALAVERCSVTKSMKGIVVHPH